KKQFSKAMKTMKAMAAVVLLGGVALGQMPGAATPRVQVEKAVKGQDRIIRRSVGATEAIDSVSIHCAVEGYLQEVNFKEGRLVHKGDVLMRIDPLRYEAAVQQAEAAITELEERMVYAQNRVKRMSALAGNQAASQEAYETAVAALATCRAKKVAAEAELVRAKKNLEDCTIRA
ncbi:MAG: biotin/lipoyl-binding protein, partial [Akkermansia sp.]|nr:biotin/lipoyl-binding protein [Akkermansia sp.]